VTVTHKLPCDGSGRHPICMTQVPHRHCECGLPMASGASQCALCRIEGTMPDDYDGMIWDGRSYGSKRRRRITAPGMLQALATAIGGLTPADYGSMRRRAR
jgi:hypothetical protein